MVNFTGTPANDTWFGTSGNDTASGGAGNDQLFGQGGDDVINGDEGDDTISGGTGNDIVNGGSGNDTLIVRNDQFAGMDLSAGDQFFGGDGVDTLSFIGNFNNFDITG